MAWEVNRLLGLVFTERNKTGQTDLEALEMAFRSALHQAGAAALTQLLRFAEPAADQREIPCGCGQKARYRELRTRPVLTALGTVELTRPYYLCSDCHHGQFPVDAQLNVENKELSPGVRRMLAVVGAEAPFDHGREQMKTLAGLEVSTKAVENTDRSAFSHACIRHRTLLLAMITRVIVATGRLQQLRSRLLAEEVETTATRLNFGLRHNPSPQRFNCSLRKSSAPHFVFKRLG